jgi:hypothetical protein
MNIDGILKGNLAKLWVILAPRMKTCQYHAVQSQPYDVQTGTAGTVVTTTSVKAFIFDHDLSLIGDGADIQVSDKRAILLADHLPEMPGIREKCEPGDRLTDHKGQQWQVLLARGDPDFYFDLTLRR